MDYTLLCIAIMLERNQAIFIFHSFFEFGVLPTIFEVECESVTSVYHSNICEMCFVDASKSIYLSLFRTFMTRLVCVSSSSSVIHLNLYFGNFGRKFVDHVFSVLFLQIFIINYDFSSTMTKCSPFSKKRGAKISKFSTKIVIF